MFQFLFRTFVIVQVATVQSYSLARPQDLPFSFLFECDVPTFIRWENGQGSIYIGSPGNEAKLSSLSMLRHHVRIRSCQDALAFVRARTPLWGANDVDHLEVISVQSLNPTYTLGISYDYGKVRALHLNGAWGLIEKSDESRLGLHDASAWKAGDEYFVKRDVVTKKSEGHYLVETWIETVGVDGSYEQTVFKDLHWRGDRIVKWWFPSDQPRNGPSTQTWSLRFNSCPDTFHEQHQVQRP